MAKATEKLCGIKGGNEIEDLEQHEKAGLTLQIPISKDSM